MKQVIWEGSSKEVLRSFPEGIRKDLGTGIMYLQYGAVPKDAKPFKTGMKGTWELRAKDASGQYRAIYASIVQESIHILHCFRKKSNKTSLLDQRIAQMRFRNVMRIVQNEKI